MLQLVRCTNRSTSNKEIQFHKVPSADKDSNLRKQWLHKIRQEGKLPNDKSFYICSDHFQDECYQRDLEVSLVKNIYPWSRFIFYYIPMLYYATLSLLMNLIT